MENEEQLLVRQILHKMRTGRTTEAETFTFKRFGSRIHSCANERFSLPLLFKGAPKLIEETSCGTFAMYGID